MQRFGTVLQQYRERAGLSQLALSKVSGVHASIINRFERDERQPASRDMVERLAQALRLAPAEHDHFLAAGHFLPGPIEQIGAADPDLLLVASILADESIPAEEREEFRTLIRIGARRWRPGKGFDAGTRR
jgi:transcriptional regulator with XRE-family HTH domain